MKIISITSINGDIYGLGEDGQIYIYEGDRRWVEVVRL